MAEGGNNGINEGNRVTFAQEVGPGDDPMPLDPIIYDFTIMLNNEEGELDALIADRTNREIQARNPVTTGNLLDALLRITTVKRNGKFDLPKDLRDECVDLIQQLRFIIGDVEIRETNEEEKITRKDMVDINNKLDLIIKQGEKGQVSGVPNGEQDRLEVNAEYNEETRANTERERRGECQRATYSDIVKRRLDKLQKTIILEPDEGKSVNDLEERLKGIRMEDLNIRSVRKGRKFIKVDCTTKEAKTRIEEMMTEKNIKALDTTVKKTKLIFLNCPIHLEEDALIAKLHREIGSEQTNNEIRITGLRNHASKEGLQHITLTMNSIEAEILLKRTYKYIGFQRIIMKKYIQ